MAKAKVAASVKDYPGTTLQAHSQTRYSWVLPGLTVFLFIVMIGAISIGSTMISGSDTLRIIAAKLNGYDEVPNIAPALVDIVWELRVPRVILAATVGAGLALAGVIMQASVQNPLAEPFILGIASGASVGAVVAILLGDIIGVSMGLPLWAFFGALGATLAVLALSGMGRRISTVKLVLAGAVVSALCTALSNFIVYMAADAEGMQSAAFWTMGSLADAKWERLFWPVLVVTLMSVYFLSQVRILDAMLLGEDIALTLGINVHGKRRWYMALVALLTGLLVAQCGIIGFVGLVIPHMARSIWGAGHKRLLPVVILSGALFLVVADLLSRILLPAGDLPVGILTALLGAPLFMKLLFGKANNFGG